MTTRSIITLPDENEDEDTAEESPVPKKRRMGKGRERMAKKQRGMSGSHTNRHKGYGSYIHRVSKEKCPDLSISRKATGIMDCVVHEVLTRVAGEASRIARMNKQTTIDWREIQTATKIVLRGELANHAINKADLARTKYNETPAPTEQEVSEARLSPITTEQ